MNLDNPYSAPESAVADTRRTTGQPFEFRSPEPLRNAVVTLGLIMMAASLAMILLQQSLQQIASHAYASVDVMRAELAQRGRLQTGISALQVLLMLVTYVLSGVCIHRVAVNVRALGARGLDDTPGWAIGWYFVPFMCLQRPFRAMQQIWLASESPLRWQKLSTPLLLRIWWGLWLAMSIHGGLAMHGLGVHHSVQELIGRESMLIFGQVLEIAAPISFLLVVIRLSRLQIRQYDTAEATPPPLIIDMARLPTVTIH
jgi:hypothetical protein